MFIPGLFSVFNPSNTKIAAAPVNGDVLTWVGADKRWENKPAGGGGGGALAYTDVSSLGIFVTQNPVPADPIQFDFTAFAASFTKQPVMLNVFFEVELIVPGAVNAGKVFIQDWDSNAQNFFSFSFQDYVTTTAAPAAHLTIEPTALLVPFDFGITVGHFNVWMGHNITAGLGLNSLTVNIMGYYHN